jgi:hypothetical protein
MAWQNPYSEKSSTAEIMAAQTVMWHDMSLHIEPKLFHLRSRDFLPDAAPP